MPFCESCGTELSSGAKFCGNCGKQLGGQSVEELASEISTFKTRKSCQEILNQPNMRGGRSGLEVRLHYGLLLKEEAIGGSLLGVTPPNSQGEIGHYGNGTFSVLLTQNYIALCNENGGPVLNGKLGFKASTGNEWGLIFPISELRSATLQKGVWTMSFTDGYIQEAEFWYLVLEPKTKGQPQSSNEWWMHDLVGFPNRNSFKSAWNFEKHRCPHAIWMPNFRSITPDKGEGFWYIGLLLEGSGDSTSRRVLASALGKEIAHYPNFHIDESSVITSKTHHLVSTPKNGPQGFSFSFEM